jgi:hypothetical protein
MRFKNSETANRILETPGELFAAARGENAIFPVSRKSSRTSSYKSSGA